MKAIDLITASLKEKVFFVNVNTKCNIVCGTLEPNRWYYMVDRPDYGKADCVILDSGNQPIYLYLIEE